MEIVKTDRLMTAGRCRETVMALARRYPFLRSEILGRTAYGREVRTLVIGNGRRRVIFTAAHHANEWITATVLLAFFEEFAAAIEGNGRIFDADARALRDQVTIYALPMVNPDGVDLVTGALGPGQPGYSRAMEIEANFPDIPFPDGWKANLMGVDLNLQYPAGWQAAREIKFRRGFTRPAPRDYVGLRPLDQPEARLLAGYTEFLDPAMVLALHSQGEEIYWQFGPEVPGARKLGEEMADVSGYRLTDAPYASSFAGYKDWFIARFNRPGYTVEVGKGQNPLPVSMFPEIFRDTLGLLVTAARGGRAR